MSPGTISNLDKKAYEHIETWRTRPLTGEYPYVCVDGVYLKRSWGGEVQNVSILVAIGVNQDGVYSDHRTLSARTFRSSLTEDETHPRGV